MFLDLDQQIEFNKRCREFSMCESLISKVLIELRKLPIAFPTNEVEQKSLIKRILYEFRNAKKLD